MLVGGFNINSNDEMCVETFYGAADKVYASENNLYITKQSFDLDYTDRKTTIYKFNLDNGMLKLDTTGEVDGYLNNQFSMDEYDGNLRLATTVYIDEEVREEQIDSRTGAISVLIDSERITANNLYVLNEKLEVIGKIENLAKDEKRVHILNGYKIAQDNIDEVIKIIKGAENTADARSKLRAKFSLSEAQANAILDLRLARLTKLEVYKLEEELATLKKLIAELTVIIGSKQKQMEVVKTELTAIKKKYGDDRRSNIIVGGKEVEIQSVEKELKQIDDFMVGFTFGKAFKKMTLKNFNASDKQIKDNSNPDDFIKFAVKARTDQILYAFTNLGNCCKIDMEIAPECRYRDKGCKFTDVCKEASRNEYPVAFFAVDEDKLPDGHLLFYTQDGLIKKTEWAEYGLIKPYYQAIKLKDGDALIAVEEDRKDTTIAFVTENGLALNALKDDIPVQGRVAGGVKGINLNKGDKIIFISQVDEEGEFVTVTNTGFYKRVIISEIEPMARYRKGVKLVELGKSVKLVYAGIVKEPYDLAVVDNFGVAFTVNTETLSIENRTTKGKTLKNENKKRMPEKVFRLF